MRKKSEIRTRIEFVEERIKMELMFQKGLASKKYKAVEKSKKEVAEYQKEIDLLKWVLKAK